MKRIRGCTLIIDNGKGEILLQLRDNNPKINYPNSWGTWGGAVEKDETPEQAIVRELKEELDYDLKDFVYFGSFPYKNKIDIHTFIKIDNNITIDKLNVREGQKAEFIHITKMKDLKFSYNCKEILDEYIKENYPNLK